LTSHPLTRLEEEHVEEEVQDLKLQESLNEKESEILYWETEDVNPNQVIYDLDKNKIIIPSSDEDLINE
jgi:hypothetical protein